jgi:hypothetical protein
VEQPAADCTPAFAFLAPVDPEAEREALEERAGIIAEGCGIDEATALREARLCIARARTWSTFIANVRRILAAPVINQPDLLARYLAEAAARYGEETARTVVARRCRTGSLRGGIQAQAETEGSPAGMRREQ